MLRTISLFAVLLVFLAGAVYAEDEQKDLSKELQAVKAIDWNDLAKLLPEKVEGMEVSKLDGGTMSMADPTNPQNQFSYSSASRSYTTKDGKVINLHILDTGFNQFLMTPFMMQMEYDSPDGSVKSTEVQGFPSKLIYDKDEGEVTGVQIISLVSKRVLVTAEGDDETVTKDDISKLLDLVDYKKLAGMAGKAEK